MRLQTIFLSIAIAIFALTGCTDNKKQDNQTQNTVKPKAKTDDGFKWEVDQFADLRVLKYKIPCRHAITSNYRSSSSNTHNESQ